jgi:polyphenol oxidase
MPAQYESPPGPAPEYAWRLAGDLPLLTWPALDELGVTAVVTTRDGGVSGAPYDSFNLGLHVGDQPDAVLSNRSALAQALRRRPGDFVFAVQSHGPSVAVVGEQDRGRGAFTQDDAIDDTDALVTSTPGLVLGVLVADCVPLVLVDPRRRLLACVHAGWRGTVTGVTRAAMQELGRLGSDPADVVACIGPAIRPSRYQVGADVMEAASAAFGSQSGEVITAAGPGTWYFDLWQANILHLLREGVTRSNIHLAALDTGPSTPFFSHRSQAPTGRFGLFAFLHPQDS